jgi:hypothetical protein
MFNFVCNFKVIPNCLDDKLGKNSHIHVGIVCSSEASAYDLISLLIVYTMKLCNEVQHDLYWK